MSSLRLLTAAALIVVFMAATCQGHVIFSEGETIMCCLKTGKQISSRLVKCYSQESSSCINPAVILTTSKDKRVCVDPDSDWVKKIIARKRQC
ncbi:C-C motif chemokine 18-like [Hyperolius riggenbachi]|uniref:C-C motif chemokine 18-like n=1 Tax=Hyperolius riggenbachi TaxID=752182 RepID=UPI0035A30E2D